MDVNPAVEIPGCSGGEWADFFPVCPVFGYDRVEWAEVQGE